MAGIFYDGFDHYATADIETKWTQRVISAGVSTTGPFINGSGRRSGSALRMATTNYGYLESVRITPSAPVPSGATCIFGTAYRHVAAFSVNANGTTEDNVVSNFPNCVLSLRKSGVTHVWVRVNINGTLSVLQGTGVLGTSSVALTQNVYQYLEVKVVIHASAGTVDIRLNGVSILALTGQVTQAGGSSTWDEIKLGACGGGLTTVDYDDLYLLDGSGSVNHDFLGDVRVDATYPNAAGNSAQFTRSTGSDQWATIDETAPNGDTDYNETGTATNRDTLNFPTAPVAGATIYAVQALASAKKTDAGGAGLKLVTRISSTDYDGTEGGLGTAYNYVRQIWDVKPSDSAAWTDGAFNAAEFGYVKST